MPSDQEFTELCDHVADLSKRLLDAESRIYFQQSWISSLENFVTCQVDAKPFETREAARKAMQQWKIANYDEHMKRLGKIHPRTAGLWDIRDSLSEEDQLLWRDPPWPNPTKND